MLFVVLNVYFHVTPILNPEKASGHIRVKEVRWERWIANVYSGLSRKHMKTYGYWDQHNPIQTLNPVPQGQICTFYCDGIHSTHFCTVIILTKLFIVKTG